MNHPMGTAFGKLSWWKNNREQHPPHRAGPTLLKLACCWRRLKDNRKNGLAILLLASLSALPAQARPALDPSVPGQPMDAPVPHPGPTVQVDANGVQAAGALFDGHCAKPTPWQARWIWADAQPTPPAVMFRRTVILREQPQAVKAWLTADMKYLLQVNRSLAGVARAGVDIGRDYSGGDTFIAVFYYCRDLTPFTLSKATNVIAAEVFQVMAGARRRWVQLSQRVPGRRAGFAGFQNDDDSARTHL